MRILKATWAIGRFDGSLNRVLTEVCFILKKSFKIDHTVLMWLGKRAQTGRYRSGYDAKRVSIAK